MIIRSIFHFLLVSLAIVCYGQADRRSSQWNDDIDYFDQQLRSYHKNLFHQIRESEYEAMIVDAKASIPKLSDFDIIIRLSEISAAIGDSHTFLHPEGATRNYVPLIISLFDEGFYVIRAKGEYERLLKGRIVRINDTPMDSVYKAIRATISADQGNEMSYKFLTPSRLTSADLLLSLKIIKDVSKFSVTILDGMDKEHTMELSAIAREDFFKDDWKLVLASEESDRPLAFQHNAENYWQTLLPNTSILYFQYNKCENAKGQSIEAFCREMFQVMDRQNCSKIIIDLRRNTGGNEKLNRPILSGLQEYAKLHPNGKVVVLMGRATHSAACNLLLDMEKEKIPAITIGEPARSKPNFYSENHFYILPNHKIRGSVSSLFRKDSFDGDDRLRIEPAIRVPIRFSDYAAGKDESFDEALNL